MNPILCELRKIAVVPVIVIENEEDALWLGKALWEGGLPCAEITFRTKAAAEAIRILSKNYPQMMIGAGTVLTTEQVDRAIAAGAKFIVSPGLNPNIVKYCQKKGIVMIPGCSHASDMELAPQCGLDAVKFFPAELSGGLPMIKELAAPYRDILFMPTGGINTENVASYLAYDRILACGGTWIADARLIADKQYDEIVKRCQQCVTLVKDYR